jgi:hypothetical protein
LNSTSRCATCWVCCQRSHRKAGSSGRSARTAGSDPYP